MCFTINSKCDCIDCKKSAAKNSINCDCFKHQQLKVNNNNDNSSDRNLNTIDVEDEFIYDDELFFEESLD